MSDRFCFLNKREDVLPFVKAIQKAADEERNALGFLVPDAYKSGAYQQKIIVALTAGENSQYVGHIFFGGVYPHARVFQTVVDKKHRQSGLASLLMNEFISLLERRYYSTVSAKVAQDLDIANHFYEKHDFKKVRVIKGGKSKGRLINIRAKLLNTPSLFNWERQPQIITDLSLQAQSYNISPQYLIDLNVIFDVVHKRAREEEAGILMKASFQNLIRVSVSEELISELERNTKGRDSDPILEMAKNFWRLANPPENKVKEILEDIGPVIFPNRYNRGKLSTQDRSDIIHLATAIHHHVTGFVTSENAILAAGPYLRLNYKIDVLSLYDVQQLVEDIPDAPSDDFSALKLSLTTLDGSQCKEILQKEKLPNEANPPLEAVRQKQVRAMLAVNENDEIIAFAWWTILTGPTPQNRAYLFVKTGGPHDALIFDSICGKISRQCSAVHTSTVEMVLKATIPDQTKHLERNGFIPSGTSFPHGELFKKVCVGDALHKHNWSRKKLTISKITNGTMLDGDEPVFSNGNMLGITNSQGDAQEISLTDLERLLYPTLIVSSDTQAVISPIKKSYADDLFGIRKKQFSFLDNPEAVLRRQRVYFCKPAAKTCFKKGHVIFFYESGSNGGRSAIIAAGRVIECNVAFVNEMDDSLLRLGVIDRNMLSKGSISGKKTVVFFENIMLFKRPVGHKQLIELGCDNGSNFISSQNITSEQAINVLMTGMS